MKQVISASRRTDIPAFYLNWLMQHIATGYLDVANPFNRKQVKRIDLTPRGVGWIVWWSRNYEVFLKNRTFFQHYQNYFHFTINPANGWLEPDMIAPQRALRQLEELVKIYGTETVVWRYDPIVYFRKDGAINSNHDIQIFGNFARQIGQLGIQRCFVSVAWLYPKVLKRAWQIPDFMFLDLDAAGRKQILSEMVDTASLYGIRLYSCANDLLLTIPGIQKGRCIDGKLLNRLGSHAVSERKNPTRTDCGCTTAVDIGDYVQTPCKYHCLYCYARR